MQCLSLSYDGDIRRLTDHEGERQSPEIPREIVITARFSPAVLSKRKYRTSKIFSLCGLAIVDSFGILHLRIE